MTNIKVFCKFVSLQAFILCPDSKCRKVRSTNFIIDFATVFK